MKSILRRNPFEIDNARNLLPSEIVTTFIPTKSFWRLLSSKNHIVLGARGSGKTELVRMLAHDHLAQFKDTRCNEVIDNKEFIGIYVPMKLEWVGSLKNKYWETEADAEAFFQWRLNITTCAAFLVTLKSCLESYVLNEGTRAQKERDLSRELYDTWIKNDQSCETLKELHMYLEDVEHAKQDQITRARTTSIPIDKEKLKGVYFENDLFFPLKRAITLASRALSFPSHTKWLLCLDEAEFLDENYHRILNSHLRTHSGDLVFKITTMPYYHHTLETNINASLSVGHDFEYIYIDRDPLELSPGDDGTDIFAKKLFNKRTSGANENYQWEDFEKLLGSSVLLDPKSSAWNADSKMMTLLKRYANSKTQERADRIANTSKFKDQISRKMHGVLLLREAVEKTKGRAELDVYSGIKMVISCSDGNPRRLIRIFNSFVLEATKEGHFHPINKRRQTYLLTKFSISSLNRVQSEPVYGQDLFKFLSDIGNFMNLKLHGDYLGTDQISSIEINKPVTDREWYVIKLAVGLGLLYPNINANSGDQMPDRSGIFRLAYVLSPHFKLLPRRGKSVSLNKIIPQSSLDLFLT